MAVISARSDESIFKLRQWAGLNENPDGDTKLKFGEAAAMRNFRITRDGNLQRRPGSAMVKGLMGAYSLQIAQNAEIVRTDSGSSSTLKMYPNATTASDGFISFTGDPVSVTHENAADCTGYFWRYDDYHIWQLVSCLYDEEAGTYTWTMKRVAAVSSSSNKKVAGLWSGSVDGIERLMAACDGTLWSLWDSQSEVFVKVAIGAITTTSPVFMFGFSNKLYLLNGSQYKEWDGDTLSDVTGYRPVVSVAVPPAGGGTTLEQVNKLNGTRCCRFSPDGKSATFQLPEKGLQSVDYVKNLSTGIEYAPGTDYTKDTANGKVTFAGTTQETFSGDGSKKVFVLSHYGISAYTVSVGGVVKTAGTDYTYSFATHSIEFNTTPASGTNNVVVNETICPEEGTNTIEVGWTYPTNFKAEVLAMRYAELFNGSQDTRVFLYGDGSNEVFYSGLDYDGNPRADYFPDENEIEIGEANNPVTGLIRHYSRLIAYKSNSAYSIQYGTITLADNRTIPAFYCTPINRSIGNVAAGQVRLVLNSPRTLFGYDIYEWKNNSSYSSNLSVDERQAKRISDRVYSTLGQFDAKDCCCWDDNDNQEYYVCYGGKALVHNYAVDAWYFYDALDVNCMVSFRGQLYFGTTDRRLEHLSYNYRTSNGDAIPAYWESGSMAFDRDWMRKYSQEIFVGLKPEANAEVIVSAQTDRKSDYEAHTITKNLMSFSHLNFARLSFTTNRKPSMNRLKLKAKKFTYYKLILESKSADTTATVVAVDIKVRYSGEVK